jgi:hypothetical protein
MKSLTDFHYWFIYVFFNKGPSKKWTIKRKKRNLNFISTVFKSICNISKIVSIYTPILCILPSIPSLERGSSPWNDCYAWKIRYSLSITSCIIRFFKKYIHKFIKKIEKFNSSIFHLALLEWLELTYAIHFWYKKANVVLIGTWACILWNFVMVRELGSKIFVVHMYYQSWKQPACDIC